MELRVVIICIIEGKGSLKGRQWEKLIKREWEEERRDLTAVMSRFGN